MRRHVQLAFMLLVAALLCPAQQMVDRIVATVNRQPILLSDWEVEIRYEAMLEQRVLPVAEDLAHGALNLNERVTIHHRFESFKWIDRALGLEHRNFGRKPVVIAEL